MEKSILAEAFPALFSKIKKGICKHDIAPSTGIRKSVVVQLMGQEKFLWDIVSFLINYV
jgi:hypothetical protein